MGARKIIVSIDFGTTYSGISWVETTQPDSPRVVSTWPGFGSSRNSYKVPTELRKVAGGWEWGFLIPPNTKRHRFFKLKLDEPEKPNEDGYTPLGLTTAYLKELRKHFVNYVSEKVSPAVASQATMDYVVTVPAIWSDAAKQATERAAAMAGFCTNRQIHLISEPEAAALYAIKRLDSEVLRTGKKFVICDAGGGTVDLISYQVMKQEPTVIKEVTEGTGGRCGSSMLNQRFRRFLKQTHGDKYWTNERLIPALESFEAYKKDFAPNGDSLSIGVNPILGIKGKKYTVSQSIMTTRIFAPIMKDIVCLIKEQISMAGGSVAAVVLVGGFGQSSYLKSEIATGLKNRTRVIQPSSGWTAVVKGAAIHGLNYYYPQRAGAVHIESRVARRSFGTSFMVPYNGLVHDPREAHWSPKENMHIVPIMLWFIKKGESYPEGNPSQLPFQCDLPAGNGPSPQTEIEIFESSDDSLPIHPGDRTRVVARLHLNLSRVTDVSKRRVGITRIGSYNYYCLNGIVEASYGSAMITYTVKLEGEPHHRVQVQYAK